MGSRNELCITILSYMHLQWRQTSCCRCSTCTTTFSAPPRIYIYKCSTFSDPPQTYSYTCTTALEPGLVISTVDRSKWFIIASDNLWPLNIYCVYHDSWKLPNLNYINISSKMAPNKLNINIDVPLGIVLHYITVS